MLPRRLAIACGVLAMLVTFVAVRGQDADKPTKLRVLVATDEEVRVLVNGKEVAGDAKDAKDAKDGERTITAPPLAKGKEYYEVTATWATNNYTKFFRTRRVEPMPGKTVTVDLRKADPKHPDNIEIRFVPTPDDVVAKMCQLAKVGKNDIVYDIGCGDGRMVITAVADFHAKRGVGIDLDPQRIKESKANAAKRQVADKVEFRVGDALKIKDLSDATVVLLYMGDDVNLLLRPILQKTLHKGARIVSHRFGMGDWKPDTKETFKGEDGDDYTILLWTIK